MTSTIEATPTQLALLSMWTENTGRSILDSGDAYGRNWERNQGLTVAAMLAAPGVTLDVRFGYPDITVSTFHWLDSFLDYDDRMQRMFEKYSNLGDLKDEPWLPCMEQFARAAHDESWARGEEVFTHNTYNGETWLDSTLQYVVFTYKDGETYALVQYHGGCDVRGGYTKPRAFRVMGEGVYEFYSEGRVSLYCTEHRGQSLGEGLFGEVRDSMHCWDSDSPAGDWVEYGGMCVDPDFQVIEPEDGSDNYLACPECQAPLAIDVYFGH